MKKNKILYVAVHFFNNKNKWRSETWIDKAFKDNYVDTLRIDYREVSKNKGFSYLKTIITSKSKECDVIFLQRGEKLQPSIFSDVKIPIIFWSTEPINLKNDVDQLLKSNIFSWVYLHSYGCYDRVKQEFGHLVNRCSVMHNALPKEKIFHHKKTRKYFAIFNRNRSFRRKWWLFKSRNLIKVIKGHYGDLYYDDLSNANISINIHYSNKNKDDFETGIFESLARGCAVVSETLDSRVIDDLGLKDVIIEVKNPKDLYEKLIYLKNNFSVVQLYQNKSKKIIEKNTWDSRVLDIKKKIELLIGS